MSLQAICEERGIALEEAIKKFKDNNVSVNPDDTLRTIAEKHNKTVSELLKMLKN